MCGLRALRMPKLTTEEVEDFLSEPGHLARIGTVDDDGMPRRSAVVHHRRFPTAVPSENPCTHLEEPSTRPSCWDLH